MSKTAYLVTLANVDSERPCTATACTWGETQQEAEDAALDRAEELLWADHLGAEVNWHHVDGDTVVAAGTRPLTVAELTDALWSISTDAAAFLGDFYEYINNDDYDLPDSDDLRKALLRHHIPLDRGFEVPDDVDFDDEEEDEDE